jgi:phosphatidate cytidylyltransferase
VADIAAYFAGRAFGRHKLAPAISPGKTWEGAGGAVVGVLVFGLILIATRAPGMLNGPALAAAAALLVALTALSIQGDLFESLLKRQAGVKDSGTLLPGHGGILDRIDSLTSTLPLVGLVTLWFAH